MIQRSHFIALGLLSAGLILQGCNSVKKTLGIDRDPPKEYDVNPSIRPLEMPPDFNCLPTPVPGMERPQDKAARTQQKEKFLGSTGKSKTLSPGQKALLNMSGAQSNEEDIRHKIDTEARMEVESPKGKPIVETLGIKKSKPKGDIINPYQEAEELQKQGVPQSPQALREVMPPSAEKHAKTQAQHEKNQQRLQNEKMLDKVPSKASPAS